MKVLIVDDKIENLYLLESLLNGYGYETVSAKNGAEAFGLALKDNFDLIISDILMPVMDGFTFCRECKKNIYLRNVPFIFYTATYTDTKDEEFALSLGADKFILKPQDPDVFIELVKNVLNDVKGKKIFPNEEPDLAENVVLREYNATLIRKLENKMHQTEENEKKLKAYVLELETTLTERKKVEKVLRQNENQLESIYNATGDVLYYLAVEADNQYRFVSVNSAFRKVTGIPSSKVSGKLVHEIIPEPSLTMVLQKFKNAIEQKDIIRWEETSDYPNGKLTGEVSISPVFDTDGNCTHLVGSVHDISDRKKSEAEILNANRQYSFVSQINQMIVQTRQQELIFSEVCRISVEYGKFSLAWIGLVDKDENVNPVAWSGTEDGYLKDIEVSKKNIPEGQGPTGTAIREGKYYYCNDISNAPGMSLWRNKALIHGYFSSIALPIVVDEIVIGALTLYASEPNFFNADEIKLLEGVVSNIAFALKSIETEKLRKHLLETLKAEEEELIEAKEKAEEMNRLKSNFLANMSHELRTPMIGILGYSEMLADEVMDPDVKETATIINESGHRLMNTLNMILNLSKIESGKLSLDFQSVDVIKTVHKSCKLFEELARRKSLSLNVEVKCSALKVNLDEMMLLEIMNNLINNALKFTSKGGVIVEITTERSGSQNWAMIKVKDTGIGISKENQAAIWEEFRQVSEGLGT